MIHIVAIAAALLWFACNLYLWSMKQSRETLLLESIVLAIPFYLGLFWYVTSHDREQ